MADANRGKGARGNRNPVGGGPPARGNRNPVGGGPPARGNRNPVGGGPPARGNLNPVGGGPPARGNRNPVGGGPPARGNLNPVGGGPPARGNRHPVGGGPPAPARRAWDDVFIFQPGERMYDQLLHWVTTMLQQQHAAGLLRQQQAGQDVVYNQFAVGQIGNRLQRTEPRGSPQVHCEEQLIRMIQQPQDMFIIYTENFTCQMRVGTERRCNCFFQVIDLALRYPQSLVVILYHQPYDIQGPSNRGAGRQGRWDQIDLQNRNLLVGNSPAGELPLNLMFIKVDWVIQDNAVQVGGMEITGITRK